MDGASGLVDRRILCASLTAELTASHIPDTPASALSSTRSVTCARAHGIRPVLDAKRRLFESTLHSVIGIGGTPLGEKVAGARSGR